MRRDFERVPPGSHLVRFVALLAVLSVAGVLVLAPLHLDGSSLAQHDASQCAICAAIFAQGTGLIVLFVLLLCPQKSEQGWAPPEVRRFVTSDDLRLPSPRAPPGIA